jgi:hypothetical protein
MDFGKRIFPAAFTGFVGMLGLNFLVSSGGSLTTLFSMTILLQGLIIFVAHLISDYLSPSVRAEIDAIF